MATPPTKPHPLFGSIVVFGASLGACGGTVESEADQNAAQGGSTAQSTGGAPITGGTTSSGGAGAASGGTGVPSTGGAAGGTGPTTPWQCDYPSQFFCDLPDGTCRCDPSAPSDPSACAAPYQFTCQEADVACRCDPARLDPATCPDPTQWHCEGPDGLDCWCDPTAPTVPEDCASTAQFTCTLWEPIYTGCWCDPAAPSAPDDCTGAEYQSCQSYDPPIGCECVCCIIR